MNTFNRILVVVLLLVAMVACTAVFVVPIPVLRAVGIQIAGLIAFLNSLQWYVRLLFGILFALTLNVVFILLLISELRKPKAKAIQVEQISGGEVMVTVESIADRLKYEVDQLPGVLRVKPVVSAKRGGVVVDLDVEGAAGVNVLDSVAPIVDVVQDVVEGKMGLRLARPPKVHFHTVAYPKAPKTQVVAETPPVEDAEEIIPSAEDDAEQTLALPEAQWHDSDDS
ncbi:MAG: hypothetical protein GX620_05535 [Chloroflexi bacterium]|nr:hypothetical protein [Chloroflexota bacterium]